jgi:hypothetical protein
MSFLGIIPTKKNNEIAELRNEIAMLTQKLGSQKRELPKDLVTIFEWYVYSRPLLKRSDSWYLSTALVIGGIILILALLQELIMILLMVSLLVLLFSISLIPPEKVTHKITTHGVKYIDKIYKWSELEEFWFVKKDGMYYLIISSNLTMPSQLILQLQTNGIEERKFLATILDRFLPRKEFEVKDDKIVQSYINKFSDGEMVFF